VFKRYTILTGKSEGKRPTWEIQGIIQGDSVARGPKILSIKNYAIEIMT